MSIKHNKQDVMYNPLDLKTKKERQEWNLVQKLLFIYQFFAPDINLSEFPFLISII